MINLHKQLNMFFIIFIQLVVLEALVSFASHAPILHVLNHTSCLAHEHAALVQFITAFTIEDDSMSSSICPGDYAKTETWKKDSIVDEDCCLWDGVMCDPITGHVTEIDLSCAYLTGAFPSNTTLFRLGHLRGLNLAHNNFMAAPIPPGLSRLSHLVYLNLSSSGFSGPVPDTIIANLTRLRDIDLSDVNVSSTLPPMIRNLSELESLRLARCGLTDEFPVNSILSLPALRVLDLGGNDELYGEFSVAEWGSPLEVVDFQDCHFTGKLPESVGVNGSLSLRSVNVAGCRFDGRVPNWMWNVTEEIRLNLNYNLVGILPTSVNTTTLARLTTLNLAINMMTGPIPAWVFSLPSLKILYLYDNLFTELAEFTNASSSLLSFEAHDNQLRGQIPDAIFELRNLQELVLVWNNLHGTIFLSQFRKLSNNLTFIGLSDNQFTVIDDLGDDDDITTWPNLEYVSLSSCKLGHFPRFLRKRENLKSMMLANNGIRGHVPAWVFDVGKTSLVALDISRNFLTGGLSHLPWKNIDNIYIHSNMFEGAIPAPSPSITFFWASKNRFTGEIPSSLCDLDSIQVLDLSHNNFTGNIPKCLASPTSKSLFLLDLTQNRLQGVIPSIIFEDCPSLFTLGLSGNLLEGPIPQSLSNCIGLQFLDLGKNKLIGTFPHWLDYIQNLEVLILGSNELHGPLRSSNVTTFPFWSLQILDISNNYFTGGLPGDLLTSFDAMKATASSQYVAPYVHQNYYYDSIVAWFKGSTRELDKIFVDLVLIDVSNNRLEGRIPEAIGDLVALRWLNLAHNNFTGSIPKSLANLSKLESLDLSSNKLEGQIPENLVDLSSLEFFNVSENNLVGRVPSAKQFGTFSDSSYLGNPGLCGELLTKKCGTKDESLTNSTPIAGSEFESSDFHVWEIVLMGCGCGMFIGSVWGYFLVWERNYYWVSLLIVKIEGFIMVYRRQRRRQDRRN